MRTPSEGYRSIRYPSHPHASVGGMILAARKHNVQVNLASVYWRTAAEHCFLLSLYTIREIILFTYCHFTTKVENLSFLVYNRHVEG
jgi:hypothetical protein